jgi:hypothetical protein
MKAEKLIFHTCSTLHFGLEPGLAKTQVLDIVSFDKAGENYNLVLRIL